MPWDPSVLHSVWTVIVFVVFVAIVVWAWSRKRRAHFAEAERIPLEEDDAGEPGSASRSSHDAPKP